MRSLSGDDGAPVAYATQTWMLMRLSALDQGYQGYKCVGSRRTSTTSRQGMVTMTMTVRRRLDSATH